jgi:hypothetical protein
MGGTKISNEELLVLHVDIGVSAHSGNRKLTIPGKFLEAYKQLIWDKMEEGFWNDILGEKEIIFIFKFRGGAVEEFILSKENQAQIAALCGEFNGDPLKKTGDILHYLAGNSFYRGFINRQYLNGKK